MSWKVKSIVVFIRVLSNLIILRTFVINIYVCMYLCMYVCILRPTLLFILKGKGANFKHMGQTHEKLKEFNAKRKLKAGMLGVLAVNELTRIKGK